MIGSLEFMISAYRGKGIIVDTNLLIVLLIGKLGQHHLKDCRATKNFIVEDFQLLQRFLGQFSMLITTPHILTEVSNLSGKLDEGLLGDFRSVLAEFIKLDVEEQHLPSVQIVEHPDFHKLGLADTAIRLSAKEKYLVLTEDFELSGRLKKCGIAVVNFNHLRQISWSA